MIHPSLCGNFLSDKKSLVAFTWTLTVFLSLLACIVTSAILVHVHINFKHMEKYYVDEYESNNYYNNNNNNEDEDEDGEDNPSGDNNDEEEQYREFYEEYLILSKLRSGSVTFVAIYTMLLSLALSLYGSTAIVGFTSLRGVYIPPCFNSSVSGRRSNSSSSALRLGMFGGAIIFFANILLVCAVIFGEVRVSDWRDNRREEGEEEGEEGEQQRENSEHQTYEIERIATVLAVTCMFLAALYSIFAIMLFLFFGNKDYNNNTYDDDDNMDAVAMTTTVANNNNPHRRTSSLNASLNASLNTDPRRENFITMPSVPSGET